MHFDIDPEAFHRLPRHPDWVYELWEGKTAHLRWRPRALHLERKVTSGLERDAQCPGDARIATGKELEMITDFLSRSWAGEDPYRSFANPLERASHDCHRDLTTAQSAVASWDGARVLGAVLLTPNRWTDAPLLDWLFVDDQSRKSGIATALLDCVLTQLAAMRVPVLTSSVSAANPASLRWHLSRGFTVSTQWAP